MSKSVEDLSTQFELMTRQFTELQTMMREALDKITRLEEWRSSADESLNNLLQKADSVVTWVDQLEVPPPVPLQPQTPVMLQQPLSQAVWGGLDLNTALVLSPQPSTSGVTEVGVVSSDGASLLGLHPF
jgi:hypothetical protein